jgi:23S rRNA-/tRNA-specific pseudouridylate synthase
VGPVAHGGQPAETRFRLIEDLGRALLVEARPLTGRKHQVRAHLACSGCPVLGDALYGPGLRSPVPVARGLLHARRLELRHPLTGALLRIESPRPADFEAVLAALRSR